MTELNLGDNTGFKVLEVSSNLITGVPLGLDKIEYVGAEIDLTENPFEAAAIDELTQLQNSYFRLVF